MWKPLLSKKTSKSLASLTKKYVAWTVQDSRKVVWNDESKYIFKSDERTFRGQFQDEYVMGSVKHGGGKFGDAIIDIMMGTCIE